MSKSSNETSDKSPTEATISRRLNKILDTRIENDKDTLDALKQLSTFFKENTLENRRRLRSKIEKRSLAMNEDFLWSFRGVKMTLDSVYSDVMAMNESVKEMTNRLHTTKTQTYQLIDQTTKLQAESQKLCLQQDIVEAFLSSFQLSPAEQAILRGSHEVPITSEFFTVLERVQNIHTNCHTLMQSGHQTAALEIMEQMALYEEAALEKLYHWTLSHCRNIEFGETSFLLTQAMACLQDRAHLFKYVMDEYCTSRRSVLVRAFICALTQGGPGGTPKPIEMHAHDPKRYIGDMLAWLHQTIPTEKENLLTLIKGCHKTDISEQVQEALSNITEGVCHPLKVRVEQILASETKPTVLYGVASLIQFYENIIGQVVPNSLLQSTLREMSELSRQTFLMTLENQVKQHLREPLETSRADLAPAAGISRVLSLLKEVLAVANISEGRQEDLKKIVSCVMEPLQQAVMESAARFSAMDMAVYLLNCLHQMHDTLSLYEFMDDRLERIQAQSDAQLDTLASEQASSLVANLNLGAIYTILQEHERGSLSSVPGMEPENVKKFVTKLDSFLLMPDVLLLPQINLITNGSQRSLAQRRAFEVIGAIYKQLYEAVHEPSNNYQNPGELMKRTPDDITQLLGGL
ncbi:conserved oligomeric Golgi complex subunit 6 [Anabrus simplex]|uniref:conserved oligomeric Golgi complex subunit 6 n=1 Tax=Anabrus simplex TaxID=316456 RepID=UPI0035A2CCFC